MGNVCLYSHLVSSGAAYLYWPGSVNFPWGQPRGYILEGDNKFLPQSQFTLRETFSLKKTLKKSTTVKMQSNHLFAYTGKNKWYEKKMYFKKFMAKQNEKWIYFSSKHFEVHVSPFNNMSSKDFLKIPCAHNFQQCYEVPLYNGWIY